VSKKKGLMVDTKRVVWIVGLGGMGQAIAKEFASNEGEDGEWINNTIVLSDVEANLCTLKSLQGELTALKRERGDSTRATHNPFSITETFDVTDFDAVYRVANLIVGLHGGIDVLVDTAGIMPQANFGLIARMKPDDLRRMQKSLDVNFMGALATVSAALYHMQKAGYGRGILFSSIAGERAERGNAVYAAAKAAVQNLVKTAAVEAPFNSTTKQPGADIRFNVVLPGITETGMIIGVVGEKAMDEYLHQNPSRGFTTVEEVAYAVRVLASYRASGINGAALPVDRGHLVRGT